jgi:SAM-dependent methyltransferase
MAKRNYWGHEIPSPQTVITNAAIGSQIDGLLRKVADLLGVDRSSQSEIIESILESAREVENEIEFEKRVKARLIGRCDRSKMQEAIRERSITIFNEITKHYVGQSLLDVGCGNGFISGMSKPRFSEIQLMDVVNYVDPSVELPYAAYKEGAPFSLGRQFDTVILLTVLHHANDPMTLLRESWKSTKGRLLIIESVFGVHSQPPSGHYELAQHETSDQIAYAVFVDWLYNRILNDDIPVPYNFTTPEKWSQVFEDGEMRVANTINLGQDIEIAPELHFLFVLERER